jgi:hypothetical protein
MPRLPLRGHLLLTALLLSPTIGCEQKSTATTPPSAPPEATPSPPARGAGVDPTANKAPPAAQPAAPAPEEETFVKLGRVKLPLPAAWRPAESGTPPMHQVHLNPGPGMTCDIGLIDEHGKPEEAERYLNGAATTYRGDVSRNENVTLGGVELQGIRIKGPQAIPRAPLVEAFVGIAGGDLVALNLTHLNDTNANERKACQDAFSRFAKALQ